MAWLDGLTGWAGLVGSQGPEEGVQKNEDTLDEMSRQHRSAGQMEIRRRSKHIHIYICVYIYMVSKKGFVSNYLVLK